MDWSSHYPAFFAHHRPAAKADETETITTKYSTPRSPRPTPAQLTPEAPYPTIADVGCGFGGLLLALSPLFPQSLILGLELRHQVLAYVHDRIASLRSLNPLPLPPTTSTSTTPNNPASPSTNLTSSLNAAAAAGGQYANISALRTNTMKFLPQYLRKHSLAKLFLCFPDPHFKQRKHKARIVSTALCAEYAFFVRPGGKVYTITDVQELGGWIVRAFLGDEDRGMPGTGPGSAMRDEPGPGPGHEHEHEHGGRLKSGNAGDITQLWERVSDAENDADPCVRAMTDETEEGKKVTRNHGRKYIAVFRRRGDPEWVDEDEGGA
jgi:tRNA (guanine-N7-)-methyltransferase